MFKEKVLLFCIKKFYEAKILFSKQNWHDSSIRKREFWIFALDIRWCLRHKEIEVSRGHCAHYVMLYFRGTPSMALCTYVETKYSYKPSRKRRHLWKSSGSGRAFAVFCLHSQGNREFQISVCMTLFRWSWSMRILCNWVLWRQNLDWTFLMSRRKLARLSNTPTGQQYKTIPSSWKYFSEH